MQVVINSVTKMLALSLLFSRLFASGNAPAYSTPLSESSFQAPDSAQRDLGTALALEDEHRAIRSEYAALASIAAYVRMCGRMG